MKKLFVPILILSVLLSGCFTSANSSTEIDVNGHDLEFQNNTVYILNWETVTYPDGTVHKTEYEYDFPTAESGTFYVNDEPKRQLTRELNAYGDTTRESDGENTIFSAYTYDENRNITRKEEYYNDQLRWIIETEYTNEGLRIKSTCYDGNGTVLNYEEFQRDGSYETGKQYSADGTYIGCIKYTYSTQNKIVKEEHFDQNDVLNKTIIRNYISTGIQILVVDGIPSSVHLRTWYWDDINRIILGNAHNGSKSQITDETAIQEIIDYMKTVNGGNGESGKGYSEGTYALKFYRDDELIYSIYFGDSPSIYANETPDGYPCRYDLFGLTIEEVVAFLSQYDESNFDWSTWNP